MKPSPGAADTTSDLDTARLLAAMGPGDGSDQNRTTTPTTGPAEAAAAALADLSAAAVRVVEATNERNRLIVAASEAGWSLRQIGAAVDISPSGVKGIIDRQAPNAAASTAADGRMT